MRLPQRSGSSMRLATTAALVLIASPALADCKEEVLAVMDRSTLAGPYRTEAAIIAGDKRVTISSTVVPPSDMQIRTVADGQTREMTKIGPRVWVKDAKGWRDAPPGLAQRVTEMAEASKKVVPALVNDVNCQGTKAIDGLERVVYDYKIDSPGGKGSSSNTLYVDPASRLPTRVVIEGRSGSTKSRTDMSYTFDPSIKLEPPKAEGE